jgi:hypothetical protein
MRIEDHVALQLDIGGNLLRQRVPGNQALNDI